MQPSSVLARHPHLPQPGPLPSVFSTTIAMAQPTVFVNPLQVAQDFTESAEAGGILNSFKDWVPNMAVPLAVGGSLALIAGAAWVKNQSKNNTILSLQKELSAQAIRAEASRNQTALAQKTITSLMAITQRASELEQKRRNSHKLEVAKVRGAIKLEADEFQQQVDARLAEFKHLQSESAALEAAKNSTIKELLSMRARRASEFEAENLLNSTGDPEDPNKSLASQVKDLTEKNQSLASDLDAMKSQVTSLEHEQTETKTALSRAVNAESVAVSEQISLKAQIKQSTTDKQSLLDEIADLKKKVAAASTAQSSDKAASAIPKESPMTSGNKRSANANDSKAGRENRSANEEAPTSEPTGKQGRGGENRSANDEAPTVVPAEKKSGAAANKDGDSASAGKQPASKPIDNSRASHLERLITSKAADYKGLVRFGPINYAEVAKSSKGLGAEHLALVMGRMMEMADESVEGRAGIAAKMGDKFTDYTPIVDQDTVEWACREIQREVEEGSSSTPVKAEPINKERRIALLQGIKAASLPRAIMVNWVQLAAMSKGLSTPLIEKVIDEAATTMRAYNVTEITQLNIAKAIEKVQGESGLSGPPSANVPSRGGFGYNQRGNYASGSSQSSPAPRGNFTNDNNNSPNSQRGGRGRGGEPSGRGGRGGRGGAAGPPKPKIPEFLRKAQEEKLKKQQSPES